MKGSCFREEEMEGKEVYERHILKGDKGGLFKGKREEEGDV